MTAKAQRTAEAVGRIMYERDSCVQALGIVLEEIGPGRARMSMTVREDMVNGHGIGHGGMIFTLADACFAYGCNAGNQVSVAAACDIVFAAPAKLGDRLVAVCEERHLRGRNGVYDVTVTNHEEEVLALFRGHSRRIQGHVVTDEELAANV